MTLTHDEAVARRIAVPASWTRTPADASPFVATTVHGHEALDELASSWSAIECRRPSAVLGPMALACVSAASGDEVRVVVVRRGGDVVAIWPLAVTRMGPFRQAVRLGRAVQCYDDILLSPNASAAEAATTAWREVRSWQDIDYVGLAQIKPGSALLRVPAIAGAARATNTAPGLDLSRFSKADEHTAALSKNRRGGLRRKAKRLSKGRDVVFAELTDPVARNAAVRDAMAFKRAWLDARHIVSPSYAAKYFEDAFAAIAQEPDCNKAFKIFTLSVDGKTVAVEIGIVCGTSYQSHLGAFDDAWAKDGVGALLTHRVIGSCIEEGLSYYDMLAPDAPFKRDWTDHARPIQEALVPISRVGRLAHPVAGNAKRAAKSIHAVLPTTVRRAVTSAVAAVGR